MEEKSSSQKVVPAKHLKFSVESILNTNFQKRKATSPLEDSFTLHQLKSPKEAKLQGKWKKLQQVVAIKKYPTILPCLVPPCTIKLTRFSVFVLIERAYYLRGCTI